MHQPRTEGCPHSIDSARFASLENIYLKLEMKEKLGLFNAVFLIPAKVFIESLTKTICALELSSWKKKNMIVVSFSEGHKEELPQEIQRGFRRRACVEIEARSPLSQRPPQDLARSWVEDSKRYRTPCEEENLAFVLLNPASLGPSA